jgi:hypothetical protein
MIAGRLAFARLCRYLPMMDNSSRPGLTISLGSP